MKKRYVLSLVMVSIMSGVAAAGTALPAVTVPTFTPWGAVLGAAVLGISGLYTIFRKK
ncbi:MAG: LPXTG cell wall anchor domain-containing protein [Nitrospiraceae bacterium]|nr:LPXTG cell wall anchor domain-containing protein [Nitrospiraceae bacterium]